MPLYTYECRTSHSRFDRVAPMACSAEPRICACGAVGDRVITATRINKDFEPYHCPVTDKVISGRVAHEENLRRTGSRVFESGERESFEAKKAREEAEFDSAIEETVERSIEAMPSDKKERLANELLAGTDVAVERL